MEVEAASRGFEVQERSECVAIPLEQEEDRINSSTPHLHSGFLCPSNLGALLESTTVSFVSGGWKETSSIREVITNSEVQRESDLEKVDNDFVDTDVSKKDCTFEK